MKKTLLLVVAILMVIPGFAQTVLRQDGIIYKLYSPESGLPYAEVAGNLLTEATDVVIPDKVTKSKVDYPVITITEKAFENCEYLTGINIGNMVETIKEYAFRGCKSMTSLNLGQSVETIGDYAFQSCQSLITVNIPNSVIKIGNGAFSGCSNITSAILGQSIKYLGSSVFSLCNSLESISITGEITQIFDSAFSGCSNLKTIDLPNTIASIGESAFEGCSSLTTITLPNYLDCIEKNAFENCINLVSIEIPNKTRIIEEAAFSGCSKLEKITIPNSLSKIGIRCFAGCSNITEIYYISNQPVLSNKNIFNDDIYRTATLYIDSEGIESAYETIPWMYFVKIEGKDFSNIDAGEQEDEIIIYFDNSKTMWVKPHIHYFNGDEYFTVWPGNVMTHLNGDIFYYRCPNKITRVVFNNGTTALSQDFIALNKHVYDINGDLGVYGISGVNMIEDDQEYPVEVYNLNGVKVGNSTDGLAKGLYIVRKGGVTSKVIVK